MVPIEWFYELGNDMITSVSKGVFIVLVFCFIFFPFSFWFICFGTGRVEQVLEGRFVGSTKMGTKKERRKKKKKDPKKFGSRRKGGWAWFVFEFFPSFSIFFYHLYFDIDDIHFVLALRPVTMRMCFLVSQPGYIHIDTGPDKKKQVDWYVLSFLLFVIKMSHYILFSPSNRVIVHTYPSPHCNTANYCTSLPSIP